MDDENVTHLEDENNENLAPQNNVNIDNEKYKIGSTTDNGDSEYVNDDIKKDNDCFNEAIIKHETNNIHSKHNKISNNSDKTENTDSVKQNDKLTYIEEFELYLKQLEENNDNCSPCPNMTSSILNNQEKPEKNDIDKYKNIEQIPHSVDSNTICGNDENNLSRPNNNTNIDRHTYNENYFNNNELNTVSSRTDNNKTLKPKQELKSDNKINKYDYKYEVDVCGDIKIIDDTEESTIISISSECSESILDNIQLDLSVDYNNMDIDFANELANIGGDDYNSSDFEFIDEEEACLEGLINKSECHIQTTANIDYEDNSTDSELTDVKGNLVRGLINKTVFKTNFQDEHDITAERDIEERRKRLYEPGPSRINRLTIEECRLNLYEADSNENNRLDSDNSSNSESEVGKVNHVIPDGEDFYQLFAQPWTAFDFQAENKAFFSLKAMHLEADDIGFNVRILHHLNKEIDVDDDIKQEAVQSANIICNMYPENSKRKRRRY